MYICYESYPAVRIYSVISFRSPSLFYLPVHSRCTGCFYFHLITLWHTPQSIGLLWTRDRPVAETSTWQHKHSQETDIHVLGGIWTRNPSKHSAADLSLRPRGHWDRLYGVVLSWLWQLSLHAAFRYTVGAGPLMRFVLMTVLPVRVGY
jgi:hypothetical protein